MHPRPNSGASPASLILLVHGHKKFGNKIKSELELICIEESLNYKTNYNIRT